MQQFLSDHHNELRILPLIETIKGSNINIALSYHSTIIAQHQVFLFQILSTETFLMFSPALGR